MRRREAVRFVGSEATRSVGCHCVGRGGREGGDCSGSSGGLRRVGFTMRKKIRVRTR